jgi:hypothetical protein
MRSGRARIRHSGNGGPRSGPDPGTQPERWPRDLGCFPAGRSGIGREGLQHFLEVKTVILEGTPAGYDSPGQ